MTIPYPITVGETYPSYKALCKQLNEPVKTGGAKVNQLTHWQTCFLWERHARRYKITKIIKPLDQRPHMQRENSKWYKNVAIILLNKIADTIFQGYGNDGYNELVLTSIEIYIVLGLCNSKFKKIKSENLSNIPIEHRLKFHEVATEKFCYILNNVLKSLKKQSIINYTKTYRLNKEGEKKARLATSEEKTLIQEEIHKLLKKYNLKSEHDVMRFHKEKGFYGELNLVLEQKGLNNCFKVYHIGFAEPYLQRSNEFIDSLETKTTAKIDINGKSYNDLSREIDNIDSEADNLDDHLTFLCNFSKLIDLTIPLEN